MEQLLIDLRHAVRLLVKQPGFTAVAVLSLALGIGINTTVFTLVSALLLKPLPGREPARLATVYTSDYSGPLYGTSAWPDYLEFRTRSKAFAGLAAYSVKPLLFTEGNESQRVLAQFVSGNFFDVLGLQASYGRTVLKDEETEGQHPVVVLSEPFWRSRFGADPGVVGRAVALNGKPFTVVGIGPAGFPGLVRGVGMDVFVPLAMQAAVSGDSMRARGNRNLMLVGRLRPGAALEQARAELDVVARQLHADHPDVWTDRRGQPRRVSVLGEDGSRVLPQVRGPVSAFLGVLSFAVSLVLLLACSNVASLLLARASARRREIAVRVALGARRSRLVRQMLTESLVLSTIAGGLGVIVAAVAVRAILALTPPLPFSLALGLELDSRVLLFALAVSLATGVAFGLAPALRASATAPLEALKAAPADGRRRRLTVRDSLVVAQVAGSLVLLAGAGLFLRSLTRAQAIDPGFDPRDAIVFSLDLAAQGYDRPRGAAFYAALQDRLAALPGGAGATLTTYLPLTLGGERRSFRAVGYTPGPGEDMEVASSFVGADYFTTMRTGIARGRGFTVQDAPGTRPVVVVNEAFVRRFWPGRDGLGETIVLPWDGGDVSMEVVGIARDGKYASLGEAPTPYIFYPHRQLYRSQMAVVVRAGGDVGTLIPRVRPEVSALDPALAVYDVKTLEAHLGTALYPARAAAVLLGLTGLLALFLAAIGLYGVLSYLVARRTKEIGVRMALGADRADVVRLVVGRGLRLAGIGLAIGLAVSTAVTRFTSFLLYDTSPLDPGTFAAVVTLLLGSALVAGWFPARRAAAVEPVIALRED